MNTVSPIPLSNVLTNLNLHQLSLPQHSVPLLNLIIMLCDNSF